MNISKRRVLAAYPDAVWAKHFGAIYDDGDPSRERISGPTWWKLEEAAWDDAAALLPKICKRCEGAGYIVLIMKARSVGISTMAYPPGSKVKCPDCKGTGKTQSAGV